MGHPIVQSNRKPWPNFQSSWYPAYLDPKDSKAVFHRTVPDGSRLEPIVVHVHTADVLAHNFYLTNRDRIPPPVLQQLRDKLRPAAAATTLRTAHLRPATQPVTAWKRTGMTTLSGR